MAPRTEAAGAGTQERPNEGLMRRHAARAVALAVIGALYLAARLPALSPPERQALAARYRFARLALPEPATRTELRTARPVHRSLEHIASWISALGAAVALADFDGDGLSNDVCYVDTRTDEVVVAPVPEVGPHARAFPPTTLDAGALYSRNSMAPMGCLPVDLDEDGALDVVVYYWGRTPLLFRRAPGAPHDAPAFSPRELVAGGERWFSNAATTADLDGDGHLDLVVGNYFPDGARILDARDDGPPQLMQDSMSRAYNGGSKRFLLCAPHATRQVDCHDAPAGLDAQTASGWTLGTGALDVDGDLLPEIYLANDFGPDRLLHNRSRPGALAFATLRGARGFGTPKSSVLGRDSFKGMGVDFGDVNGDGVLDIYVSNIAATYALEESHLLFLGTGRADELRRGRAPYREGSESFGLSRSGWAWDARLADFDNDGDVEVVQALGFIQGRTDRWPELHELALGNDALVRRAGAWPRFQPGDGLHGGAGLAFFARDASGRFEDLAAELALADGPVTRGIAIADVDGDGDLDFASASQWGASALYRNEAARPHASLVLRLLLPADAAMAGRTSISAGHRRPPYATRAAVGATATVSVPAVGQRAGRHYVAQVDGGSGHSGKRGAELHFGLGDVWPTTRLSVELRWRDAFGQRHEEHHWLTPGWHTVVLGSASDAPQRLASLTSLTGE